jgi:hypothetical protein
VQADDPHVHLEQLVTVEVRPTVHEDQVVWPMLTDVAAPLVSVEHARAGVMRVHPGDGVRRQPARDLGGLGGRDRAQECDADPEDQQDRRDPAVDGASPPVDRAREPGKHPGAGGAKPRLRDDR